MAQQNQQEVLSLEKRQEKDLEVLIKARYPIIWLVTHEELRTKQMIFNIAQPDSQGDEKFRNVYSWNLIDGLEDITPWKIDDKKKKDFPDESTSPELAIEEIMKFPNEGLNLVVFYDLHPFLEENPMVIRALKNLAFALEHTYTNLIIVSSQLVIPPELEKFIAVIDLELPSYERLENVFNAFIQGLKSPDYKGKSLQVDFSDNEKHNIISAAQGLTNKEFEEALAKSVVSKRTIDKAIILEEKRQAVRKSGALEFYETQEEIASVGGMDSLKEYILERHDCFSDNAQKYGLPTPKGILLLGIQGCGKSLMCKAVSSLWGMPLLRLDVGAIFGGFVGESESNMRKAVKLAEAVSPCILWVDEIEKGLSGSQSSNYSDAGTTSRVFGFFITWMQEKTKPVYLIATANDVTQLPPELLRKGRFDEIFFVDLPVEEEREEIFKIHLKKRTTPINGIDINNFDLSDLVERTRGYSGAEIEQAVIDALYRSYSRGNGQTPVIHDDLVFAISATKPLSVTMSENIEEAREWIEGRARKASSAGSDVAIPSLEDLENIKIEL